MDWNKENFANNAVSLVNMAPKYWALGKCSEHWKLSVLGLLISPKLKKLEGYFPGGENRELGIKKSK